MKKYLSHVWYSFIFVSFSLHPFIPFNPLLNQKCEIITDDKQVKGEILLFDREFVFYENQINALYDASNKSHPISIGYYDNKIWKKFGNNDDEFKDFNRWVTWDKEDTKAARLFRYFMFYDIMRIMEGPFRELSRDCQKEYIREHGKSKAFGNFEDDFSLNSVGDLEKEFNNNLSDLKKQKNKPGNIEILDFYKICEKEGLMAAFEQTDIRALQEKNPGAWFQLASNFDCLEGNVAAKGLEYMNKGPVQGENAVATTMGAGIVRTYLIPKENRNLLGSFNRNHTYKNNDIKNIFVGIHKNVVVTSGYYAPFVRTNQNKDEFKKIIDQIALFIKDEETKKAILRGAHVFLDFNADTSKMTVVEKELQILYKKSEKQIEESNAKFNFDRLEFLLKNDLVKTNRNPVYVFNKRLDSNKPIKITQVFTATIRHEEGKFTETQQNNAQIILKAMYKGTVLAAAVGGCKTLFLTLVGTGAFGNEVKWVMDALDDPMIIEAIRYTGMKVLIVLFHDIRGGRSIKDKPFDSYDKKSEVTAYDGIYGAVGELNKKIQAFKQPAAETINTFARALKSIKKSVDDNPWGIE